jgi:hypothetical protein
MQMKCYVLVKSRANDILMIIYACAVFNTLNCALLITCFDMRFENDFVSFDDINWSVDLSCVFISFWKVEFAYCVGKIYDDICYLYIEINMWWFEHEVFVYIFINNECGA